MSANSLTRKATAEAITSAGGARKADSAAPDSTAPAAKPRPSRRCTRSRNTSARPTINTPEGAISPGATGTRQGPFGTQKVPAWPISQFAAGMHSPKPIRASTPSARGVSVIVSPP